MIVRIIAFSEIQKYNRLDANFYLHKEKVEEFLRTHRYDKFSFSGDNLREKQYGFEEVNLETLTTQQIEVLYILIKKYVIAQRRTQLQTQVEKELHNLGWE